MRLLTTEERQQRYDEGQSARTIAHTPALIDFLNRADVRHVRFQSGWHHVFVGNRPFVGLTLLAAIEAAKKEGL